MMTSLIVVELRPDPDELLARVKAEEARARRGRLRIFFGATAGVGKTYAMLERRAGGALAGAEVVVGYVEPHGRAETERLMEGLERLADAAGRLPRHRASRVRSRRGVEAPPQHPARRRARAFESRRRRARTASSEALAGHRGAARCRHQRLDDAERPAPREPERPRRADHRRQAARDGAGSRLRRGRRGRAHRPAARRSARATARRQGLRRRRRSARRSSASFASRT